MTSKILEQYQCLVAKIWERNVPNYIPKKVIVAKDIASLQEKKNSELFESSPTYPRAIAFTEVGNSKRFLPGILVSETYSPGDLRDKEILKAAVLNSLGLGEGLESITFAGSSLYRHLLVTSRWMFSHEDLSAEKYKELTDFVNTAVHCSLLFNGADFRNQEREILRPVELLGKGYACELEKRITNSSELFGRRLK